MKTDIERLNRLSVRISLTHVIKAGIKRHFKSAKFVDNKELVKKEYSTFEVHLLGFNFEIQVREIL